MEWCLSSGHEEKNSVLLQIGFGFCKGDDNFGGGRRKDLDDFTKVREGVGGRVSRASASR